jgi:hypothetical protein
VAVATSRILIFPMPGQVVLGIVELMQQGLLLKHVLASLLCGKKPLEDTAKLWVEDARLWN